MTTLVVSPEEQGELICQILRDAGFETVLKTSVKDAIQFVAKNHVYDVVYYGELEVDPWRVTNYLHSVNHPNNAAPIVIIARNDEWSSVRLSTEYYEASNAVTIENIHDLPDTIKSLRSGHGCIRLRLLLVDDNPDSLRLMKRGLSKIFDVDAAPNVTGAISLFKPDKYDVVLTDIAMPGKTGIDLLRRIRELSPSQLCVAISSQIEPDQAVELADLDAYLISKPGKTSAEILWKLQRILSRSLFRSSRLFYSDAMTYKDAITIAKTKLT